MRAAYVCADPGVPVWGTKGCSIHVQQVLVQLLRQGYNVDLIARRFDGDSPPAALAAYNDRLTVHRLATLDAGWEAGERERQLMLLDREVRLVLERHGPFDLVYERHGLWKFVWF